MDCLRFPSIGNKFLIIFKRFYGGVNVVNFTQVQPLGSDGKPISEAEFTRSGLLGFLGPGGLVFVCGSRDGLMTVTGT